jgi:hypothetical protein
MLQAAIIPVRCVAVLVLATSLSACARPNPNDEYLSKLESKDFLKYAGPKADTIRAEIRQKGWAATFGDSGRTFSADGLTLAKGGVVKFVDKLRPFLEGQGVKMPEMKDDLRQESYSVLIDGAALPIWTKDELARELGLQPGVTSGIAAARSFALVNKLLEKAGSKERAHALYSGAALSLIFVTDDLLAVIKADPMAVPKFIPYQITTDFPFFGQPQS